LSVFPVNVYTAPVALSVSVSLPAEPLKQPVIELLELVVDVLLVLL